MDEMTTEERIADREHAREHMRRLKFSDADIKDCIFYLPMLPQRADDFVGLLYGSHHVWKKLREEGEVRWLKSANCSRLFLSWLRNGGHPPAFQEVEKPKPVPLTEDEIAAAERRERIRWANDTLKTIDGPGVDVTAANRLLAAAAIQEQWDKHTYR